MPSGAHCSRCGTALESAGLPCPRCAASREEATKPIAPPSLPSSVGPARWVEARRIACAACGQRLEPDWTHCAGCGTALDDETADEAFGRPRHDRHLLVELDGSGAEGRAHELPPPRTIVGRSAGHLLFGDDVTLSGRHALLEVKGADCFVTDLGSTNGTFVAVRGAHPLVPGDVVQVGGARLLTRATAAGLEIVHVKAGGRTGASLVLGSRNVVLGRDGGDLPLPADARLSRRHAEIAPSGGGHVLRPLSPTAPTFVLVTGRRQLVPGDRLLLGGQLLEYRLERAPGLAGS